MVGLLGFGVLRRGRVYEAFVDGAKDGFQVAVQFYLVAILVAVGMFEPGSAMGLLIEPLGSLTRLVGLPPEATLPITTLLSGSRIRDTRLNLSDLNPGPDTYVGYLVSTFEFNGNDVYVLAVYFGAVQIRRGRQCAGRWFNGRPGRHLVAAVFICVVLFA